MPHDIAPEPVTGLPERPPKGERILWQGRPDAWALARDAFNLKWVMGYFVLLAAWRLVAAIDLMPVSQAVAASVPFLVLGACVCGLLTLVAWVMARSTVYTITTARVAMRVGAALIVTLNIPYSRIANVAIDARRDGTGTLALEPTGPMPVGFLVCWPHTRPWHFARPQAALRCIPEAAFVGGLLADAAEAKLAEPKLERRAPAPAPAVAPGPAAMAAE